MDYKSIERNMSKNTFRKFKEFIESNIGICIPDAKKIMVESRLLKRLKALNFSSYDDYLEYFLSINGQKDELPRFVECITTNKTDFFREVAHFDFLRDQVLPELNSSTHEKEIRLWSAAASTGAEAYTMAMFVEEYLEVNPVKSYKILATDISEEVLNVGKNAVYSQEVCEPIPTIIKKKYCLISKNRNNPTILMSKKLREKIIFRTLNLISESYQVEKMYHVIFLRNVMIYFNKETQTKILNNLYKHLHPDGYLFLGHSENLADNSLPFKRVGPSIYVKKETYIHAGNN